MTCIFSSLPSISHVFYLHNSNTTTSLAFGGEDPVYSTTLTTCLVQETDIYWQLPVRKSHNKSCSRCLFFFLTPVSYLGYFMVGFPWGNWNWKLRSSFFPNLFEVSNHHSLSLGIWSPSLSLLQDNKVYVFTDCFLALEKNWDTGEKSGTKLGSLR